LAFIFAFFRAASFLAAGRAFFLGMMPPEFVGLPAFAGMQDPMGHGADGFIHLLRGCLSQLQM